MSKNKIFNDTLFMDYLDKKVSFYLVGDKRIVATIKEVRRYEILVERKVKYKSGELDTIQTVIPKGAIVYTDII
ncbi:hypothetical protein [Staphylococcus caprae]|uniref:hypothetical protein n=1 Tax=Staphylococcus caprae TaxID=29380 RepID=UPI000CD2A716|nr:hypothetical protein [Staphylococcus caprae]POA06064.1 hypothetical protein CD155_03725 [Staphylococcus caprae]SUL89874.1 Uncharacterised protein [Staphylococcus caprae]